VAPTGAGAAGALAAHADCPCRRPTPTSRSPLNAAIKAKLVGGVTAAEQNEFQRNLLKTAIGWLPWRQRVTVTQEKVA
jgi:hypothetical protein